MNEHDFDEMLRHAVPELPPEDIIRKATPCRTAINHILTGIVLCTFTLNLLALNYILPAAGMILLLLGFRSLRCENLWFRLCWILTIIRTIDLFAVTVLNATIYQKAFFASPLCNTLKIAELAALMLLLVCFWQGIAAVQKKAETGSRSGNAAALLIWYSVLLALVLLQYSGWILIIAMILCFILILRNLFCLSKELKDSGYVIQAAAVRISDRTLVMILTAILVTGIVCGYIFFSSYSMDWQKEEHTQTAEINAIKENLLTLGYPGTALDDLSKEDILLCENAVRIVIRESDEAINDGRTVPKKSGDTISFTTVYDTRELHMTNVAVQLDEDGFRWRIFHHFLWTINPGFYGTEALQIWPAYQNIESSWISSGDLTGQLLYDSSDGTYISSFHSLEEESCLSDSLLLQEQDTNAIFAGFSFPRDSERQRGYVAYGVEGSEKSRGLLSTSNYVHQHGLFQYPVETALDSKKRSFSINSYPFTTAQSILQVFFSQNTE